MKAASVYHGTWNISPDYRQGLSRDRLANSGRKVVLVQHGRISRCLSRV